MLSTVCLHRQEAGVYTEVAANHLGALAWQESAGMTNQGLNTVNTTSLVGYGGHCLIRIRVTECDALDTRHFTSQLLTNWYLLTSKLILSLAEMISKSKLVTDIS